MRLSEANKIVEAVNSGIDRANLGDIARNDVAYYIAKELNMELGGSLLWNSLRGAIKVGIVGDDPGDD